MPKYGRNLEKFFINSIFYVKREFLEVAYNDVAYCGVSFQKGGKTHYGWVKFRFNTVSRQAFIYGYAYEAVPNKSIKAGATK